MTIIMTHLEFIPHCILTPVNIYNKGFFKGSSANSTFLTSKNRIFGMFTESETLVVCLSIELLKVLPETQPKNPGVNTCTSWISAVQPVKLGVIFFWIA